MKLADIHFRNCVFKTILCAIFFFSSCTTFAQNQIVEQATEINAVEEAELYDQVEKKPQFPGGLEAFYDFIGKSYKGKHGVRGKVYVQFVIEKDGSLTDITVLQDIGHGTGKEAVRVLKKSPKWTPGKQDGKNVRVLFSLPITIY